MPREHDADFQGSFFALEMGGLTIGWFTGCSGLSLEYDTVTFKEGNGSTIIERKRPGKPKYSEIVLKRGFTKDKALYDWFDAVVKAADKTPYKTGSIVIYDRTQTEVARFNIGAVLAVEAVGVRPRRGQRRGHDRGAHDPARIPRLGVEERRWADCRPSTGSRCRRATSTPRARCTATAPCAWRRRATRSSRSATRRRRAPTTRTSRSSYSPE